MEISCEVRNATARECGGREMTAALFLRKVRLKWAYVSSEKAEVGEW